MKKFLIILTALMLVMAMFTACGEEKTEVLDNSGGNTEEKNPENTENENEKFTLEYPEDMQELGFTEPLILDKAPERVVCLSAAPVLALYELGVNMVGIPNSMVVQWPEDLAQSTERVSFSVMSPDDFDYEAVAALEPDLVLLASNGADTAGKTLEDLGISVYYLYAGHTVSYESIKMQTEALIEAFGKSGDAKTAGENIMQRFSNLESSIENAKKAFSGKTVMVLQSGDAQTHYIQTKGGTLGSMLDMLGFENVFENPSPMVQLDYEQALDYQPDWLVCVGATDAESHRALMDEAFAYNPDYWNAYTAVSEGRVICLDVTYVSTAGINVIDNISTLIDVMS